MLYDVGAGGVFVQAIVFFAPMGQADRLGDVGLGR